MRRRWTDGYLFANARQQDANDAFFKMLDACNEADLQALWQTEVGRDVRRHARVAYTTPFWKIFGSLTREEVTCQACGKSIVTHAVRSTHTIILPEEEPQGSFHTIETLFMNQLGNEPLNDVCAPEPGSPELGGCNAENTRQKSTVIIHSAPVLVLHVLRFTWSRVHQRPVKLGTHVDFDTSLPPIAGTSPYDLRAVVEHRGLEDLTSTNSGHYVAFVRAQDSRWYECNDARPPRARSVEEVRRAQAYMLFYERRD